LSLRLHRRQLLAAGTFGLGALAAPGAAAILAARGFTHNVASGEPGHYKAMLWTRYVPAAGESARLDFQVARAPDFVRAVSGGTVTSEAANDWCVKPVAENLEPGTTYFYRFIDANGRFSPVGRTRTLPNRQSGAADKFTLGIFSCSNLPFGWFNAYAHAAAREDIDLMLHLGDYLYEYESGRYPSAEAALPGRMIEPAHEMVALADYRLRYASYRADPDLQRLHQLFPMVMMWDDHESANDSWAGGAENHQPDEGAWTIRKRAAMQAYREWLPVSDEPWKAYRIGDLAHLIRPETRLTARSRPLDLGEALAGSGDPAAALAAFRDGPWQDPSRTLLGAEQEAWLAERLRLSAGDGAKWQVLAQQVIMGTIQSSPRVAEWVGADASEQVRQRSAVGLAAARAGLPFNFDQWDGYPAARERLLKSALDADANLVVLSGDSHNGWAFDLDLAGTPAGVEFAGHSVTSPGYEAYLPRVAPSDLAAAIVENNRQLKWANTQRRGYMTLELTPERATSEWLFLDTVRARSTRIAGRYRMSVARGTNRIA
jgi:alkaline phosphatase D